MGELVRKITLSFATAMRKTFNQGRPLKAVSFLEVVRRNLNGLFFCLTVSPNVGKLTTCTPRPRQLSFTNTLPLCQETKLGHVRVDLNRKAEVDGTIVPLPFIS